MRTSIVSFGKVKENKIWRLEAEFFNQNPEMGVKYFTGENVIDFVQYGTSKELNENCYGYPVLRLNEFDSLFIKSPSKNCNKINLSIFRSLSLKKDDVLICRTNGNPKLVGKSALVPEDYDYAFASYLFRVRPKRNLINSATLAVYLNSKVGRAQIEKNLMVSNQANFSPAKFREIKIPVIESKIQNNIEKIVYLAFDYLENAKSLYQEAKKILLSELNLLDWKPKHRSSFAKNFSDAKVTGRIDAEYYQPMHEDVVNHLKAYRPGCSLLGDIVKINDSNFIPKDNAIYKYIELASISTNGNITGFSETAGKELPTRARRKVKKGDLIVSSIEGSLSSIALITDDLENALCSTGFYVITSDVLNSETLLVLLKSPIGQLQLKRGCSGTILTAINKNELSKIVLPKLRNDIQEKIKLKVTGMYKAKDLSNKLLAIAKQGVEMAIEADENQAKEWMNNELIGIGINV